MHIVIGSIRCEWLCQHKRETWHDNNGASLDSTKMQIDAELQTIVFSMFPQLFLLQAPWPLHHVNRSLLLQERKDQLMTCQLLIRTIKFQIMKTTIRCLLFISQHHLFLIPIAIAVTHF